ncbi:hypothetical protein GCM10009422_21400 [Brevundimonas kwangchunensis]|uniref:Uncharacterized protein n=1 Tax=Brevundimonas kwangchunensis TaxID=322163 RepID=A0ABN1GZQ4_9CAUL
MLLSLIFAFQVEQQPPTWVPDDERRWVQTWLRPTGETVTESQLRSASTQELAARLLPVSVAGAVTSHQIGENTDGLPPRMVVFHGDATPVEADACRRTGYTVTLKPAGDRNLTGETVSSSLELALAPGCHGEPGWRMMRTNPAQAARSLELLRWFANLKMRAAGGEDLAVSLACTGFQPDPCAAGDRAVLAALPLHQASSISMHGGNWYLELNPGRRDQLHWRIRIHRPAEGDPSIRMDWTPPPPF